MFRAGFLKTTLIYAIVLAGLLLMGCEKHEHPTEHPEDNSKEAEYLNGSEHPEEPEHPSEHPGEPD